MSEDMNNIHLEYDEQITSVMIYTSNRLSWGQIISKEAVSAGRILLGMTIPDFLTLHNAQMVITNGKQFSDRFKFSEMNISTTDILGFHPVPPKQEPIDYDPNEPNRIMAPITAMVGDFSFSGVFRISSQSSFTRTLGSSKATFLSFYETEIKQTQNPQAKAMRTDFALIRREGTIFTEQKNDKPSN